MPRRKQPTIPDELLDRLLAGSDPRTALADGGLLDGLKKALAERALNAELDHHLETGEPDGRANGRNGYSAKSVLTDTAKLDLQIPRDRLSTFDPQLIPPYSVRPEGANHQWRKISPGELSIASVADERLGWVTDLVEAS